MMIALTVKVADGDYRVRYGEQVTFQAPNTGVLVKTCNGFCIFSRRYIEFCKPLVIELAFSNL
jgi:hypothetical protein